MINKIVNVENIVLDLLGDSNILVLATSFDNRVTARSVSCVIFNNKIYLQTDIDFLKYKQIIKNPNIAFCKDNIQIEGVAKPKGHPFLNENIDFLNLYKKHHFSSFKNYSHLENEVVIEVEPTLITKWVYDDGRPLRISFNLRENKCFQEYYNKG